VSLESIAPSTGTPTAIGNSIHYESQAQGLSSIDASRKTYFLIGYNQSSTKANLVGLSLTTGAVTTDILLPFAESAFVGVGQTIDVDPTDGNVFVGGQLVANGPHVVGKLDISTGKFTPIVALNATLIPVLGAASTFDSNSRQMFVQLGSKSTGEIVNYAIDVETKAVTAIPDTQGHVITTMAVRRVPRVPARQSRGQLPPAPGLGRCSRCLQADSPCTASLVPSPTLALPRSMTPRTRSSSASA